MSASNQTVTDRDRQLATDAIRRGVPLGEVKACACFSMDSGWVDREPCNGICREAMESVARAIAAERERCAQVVLLARMGERDTDLRSIMHAIRNPQGGEDV